MAEITAKLVKELREKSGAGVMDAKKALVEVEGDIEKAIELLREKGMAKAAKKADRVAAEGLTGVYVNGNVVLQLLRKLMHNTSELTNITVDVSVLFQLSKVEMMLLQNKSQCTSQR